MTETAPAIELYLVRHAQTVTNLDRNIVGGRDAATAIDTQGIQQSISLGEDLRRIGMRPDLVFSSPATRTQQTARYCLAAMGCELQPVIDDRLQEMSQGLWEGRLRTEVYTQETVTEILRDPEAFKAPEGESITEVAARKMSFLGSLASEATNYTDRATVVLAFGHGLATRIAAGTLLNWPAAEMIEDYRTPNISLSLFTYSEAAWQSVYVGRDAATMAAF
jgi:alpha-ribazole phosphatase